MNLEHWPNEAPIPVCLAYIAIMTFGIVGGMVHWMTCVYGAL